MTLFERNMAGYSAYRIPALILTPGGTLLAFAEARRDSRADDGQIDLAVRRSRDHGATWSDISVVFKEKGVTTSNPCLLADHANRTVVLLFCKNPAAADELDITAGRAERTVWVSRSADDGVTWSEPADITRRVKRADWTWYATGPGHGVQLPGGRLVVACNHAVARNYSQEDPHHAHLIYSDDGGSSWALGAVAPPRTGESQVAVLPDGSIYLNARGFRGPGYRAAAVSRDGGETLTSFRWDKALREPVNTVDTVLPEPVGCQASITTAGRKLLYTGPAAETRARLTLRTSDDGGVTWPGARLLCEGPAAYSDLAVLDDHTVVCLFEAGDAEPYETLRFVRIKLAKETG